jgi:hypothetical protein
LKSLGRFAIIALAMLFNLLPVVAAAQFWRDVIQVQFGGPYAVAEVRSGPAWFFGIWALLAWGCIIAGLRRQASPRWLIFPLVGGVIAILAIPGHPVFYRTAQESVRQRLLRSQHFLEVWSGERGRLPATQDEVLEAAQLGSVPSPYERDGVRLPYRVVFVANAPGPVLHPSLTDPGVFYYALDNAGSRYWLTVATLDGPSGEKAVMLSEYETTRVVEGKAPEVMKPAEPAVRPDRKGPLRRPPPNVDPPPPNKKPNVRG